MPFKEKPTGSSGSSLFLKIKDGESVKGVFRGEQVEHWILWGPSGSSPATKDTPKADWKCKRNFIVRENGALVAKIFDFGRTIGDQIEMLEKAGYDMEKTVVMISRKGQQLQSKYTLVAIKESDVTPMMEEELKHVKLKPLTEVGDDDVSFDPEAL